MNKNIKKIFASAVLLMSLTFSQANFIDAKNSPYSGAIEKLGEKGILNGYADGTFRPKNNITRAELVKIFFEAKKIKKVPFYGCFSDVPVDSWFAQAVCQSRQMGLVAGYPNGLFKPNNNSTFAEGLKIGMGIFGTNFSATSSWYQPYIDYVQEKNIFGKKIAFNSLMTREQAAQLAFAQINQYEPEIFSTKNSSSSSSKISKSSSSVSSKINSSLGAVSSSTNSSSSQVSSASSSTISSSKSSVSSSVSSVFSNSGNNSNQLVDSSTILPRDFKTTISLGCNQPAPSIVPSSSVVNGVTRHYITDIPVGYNPNLPTKLIIGFHGRTNSNKQFRDYTKIHTLTNAIVVYPSALPEATSPRNWANAKDDGENLRDFAFFDQILVDMSQKYCIDKKNIYVMGHSLGGRFSNTLGCVRGDIIAGVGTVGGSITKDKCVGNPDYMIMHNPADNLAPYAGGVEARDYALKQNGCDIDSKKTYLDGALNCVQYSCQAGSVVWCPHNESNTWGYYYPHTWPKNATKMILDFFSAKNS